MNSNEMELIAKVKNSRDMVAFHSVVVAYQEKIYFLIRRMLNNHEDTQDLLQETFIKSLKNINQLKDPGKFGAWINRIAINLVMDFKRKNNNNEKVSLTGNIPLEVISEQLVEKNENGDNSLSENEIKNQLYPALARLPIKHREAFMLFHYQEMPVKHISEYLNCPESTVRSYIYRAIKKLRIYLKDYYELTKE
ncbi:hypothetical protein AMJ80_04200 [bacterium SM23_31]|nr:MAG: hypothetical protein AMJ80_04200 [bacterium SM23_31]